MSEATTPPPPNRPYRATPGPAGDLSTGAGAGGEVKLEEFGALLERAFATYGLSVVTDRALPDARDGLKPVQRRILYCMWVARFLSTRSTVKSAEVVGRVLGDYH